MDNFIDDLKPGMPRPSLSTMYTIKRMYKDEDYLSQVDALSRYAKSDYDIDRAKMTHCITDNTDVVLFNKTSDITPVTGDEMYVDHIVDVARLDGVAKDSVSPTLVQHFTDTVTSAPTSLLKVGDTRPAVAMLPGYLTYSRQQIENFRKYAPEFSYVGVDALGALLKPIMYNHKLIVSKNAIVHMKPPRDDKQFVKIVKKVEEEYRCLPINYKVKINSHGFIRYDPNKHDFVIMVNDDIACVVALYKPNSNYHAFEIDTINGRALLYVTKMSVKQFLTSVAQRGYYFISRIAYTIGLQFFESCDRTEANFVANFPKYLPAGEVPIINSVARTIYENPLLSSRIAPHHVERSMEQYRRYREHVTRVGVQNLFNSLTAMDELFLSSMDSQLKAFSKDYVTTLYDRCVNHASKEIRARAQFLLKSRPPREELLLKLHALLPALTDKEIYRPVAERCKLTKTYTRRGQQ